MKIEVTNTVSGVELGTVDFGTVVTRRDPMMYYLVVSVMDGTERRCLVTLGAGTLKEPPQDTRVNLVDATLVVGPRSCVGAVDDAVTRDAERYRALRLYGVNAYAGERLERHADRLVRMWALHRATR